MTDETPDVDRMRAVIALGLLGSVPTLTAPEVWERSGADEELGRRLWRAMGFPELDDDVIAFTESDVDALRGVSDLLENPQVSPDVVIRFTRLLGQSMSRVADAILRIGDRDLDEVPGELDEAVRAELLLFMSEVVNPLIESQLVYLYRRHLYAGAVRQLATAGDSATELTVVGFADVVSFTRLSGQLPEDDLSDLLETFEQVTGDEIAEHGGRVIKLIGDAVMFEFAEPIAASACALHLVEHFGGDHPDLRVGLAYGDTIARLGDLFGPTVNLASRLVGYARPGSVLVDGAFADAIDGVDELVVRPLRPRVVKGLGMTRMYRLGWRGDQDPGSISPMSASIPARISSARAARRRRFVPE